METHRIVNQSDLQIDLVIMQAKRYAVLCVLYLTKSTNLETMKLSHLHIEDQIRTLRRNYPQYEHRLYLDMAGILVISPTVKELQEKFAQRLDDMGLEFHKSYLIVAPVAKWFVTAMQQKVKKPVHVFTSQEKAWNAVLV